MKPKTDEESYKDFCQRRLEQNCMPISFEEFITGKTASQLAKEHITQQDKLLRKVGL